MKRIEPDRDGAKRRVAIVQARFNPSIGKGLLAGARREERAPEAGVSRPVVNLT